MFISAASFSTPFTFLLRFNRHYTCRFATHFPGLQKKTALLFHFHQYPFLCWIPKHSHSWNSFSFSGSYNFFVGITNTMPHNPRYWSSSSERSVCLFLYMPTPVSLFPWPWSLLSPALPVCKYSLFYHHLFLNIDHINTRQLWFTSFWAILHHCCIWLLGATAWVIYLTGRTVLPVMF